MVDHNNQGEPGGGDAADDFEAELLGELAGRRPGGEDDREHGRDDAEAGDADDADEAAPSSGAAEAEQTWLEADTRQRVSVDSVPLATAWLRGEVGADDGALAHLFRQHGRLVRVHASAVETVGADELAAEVNYRYLCMKDGRDGLAPAMFPEQAAKQAVSAPYLLPNVRDIRGVIETPVFRPDGSLLSQAGFDEATGLLYRPGRDLGASAIAVDGEPSATDVAEAVELLAYPVAQFPFVSDADRANWLGAVLTPLLAEVVPGPYKLVLVTANQQGSGKTYLAEIIRALYGGPFHAEYPRSTEEFSKLVTADLLHTTGLVPVFDNVKGTLGSGPLAALLTSRTWAARVLGRTLTVEADNNRMWVATGNNVSVDDDMARRVLSVRIATDTEHPEDRVFDLNPVSWVRANRPAYLAAAATLIRAWFARGGGPVGDDSSGDVYHQWRTCVAEVLASADVPGGFDGTDTRVARGTGKDEWGALLAVLSERFGSEAWTAKDAANAFQAGYIDEDALPGPLVEKLHKPTLSWSLGRWLMNRDGTIASGMKAVNVGRDRTNKTLWRIEQVSPPA